MKNLFFLLIILSFLACGDDTSRDFELNVELTYDDEVFAFFQDYVYPDGTVFRVTNLSSYISDITLKNDETSEVISEVEFLDLGKSHLDPADPSGYTLLFGDVNIENINAMDFRVGISSKQNETVPSDYDSGHPLAKSSEYWASWDSYIMCKIEGFYDENGDGQAQTGFALHLGSDAVSRSVSLSDIIDGDNRVNLTIDVAQIFKTDNNFYDLRETPTIHKLEQQDLANYLSTNFAEAIKVKN